MNSLLTILDQFLNLLNQQSAAESYPLFIASLLVSLLVCFVGYRLTKFFVALIGFGVGAAIGTAVSNQFFDSEVITLLIAVIAGFFVAMLAVYIYGMGVFLLAFFCGAATAGSIVVRFVSDQMVVYILMGAIGLLVAVLSVIFLKPFLIVLTAVEGGFKAAQYLAILIPFTAVWFMPVLAVVLVALGILIQFLTTKNYKLARSGDRISKY